MGFRDEFRDAVTPRAVFLVIGVAFIQVAFITSYVGAFHHPEPHGLPVAVVAPAADRPALLQALNGIDGHPLQATAADSVAAGTRQLLRREVFGVLVVDPSATREQLLEASASGVSAAVAVTDVLDQVATHLHRTIVVRDIRPPSSGDRNGLTSFYLVIGWIVGGYLVASILGISTGSRPANARGRRCAWRRSPSMRSSRGWPAPSWSAPCSTPCPVPRSSSGCSAPS